jgi:hypothetical protein
VDPREAGRPGTVQAGNKYRAFRARICAVLSRDKQSRGKRFFRCDKRARRDKHVCVCLTHAVKLHGDGGER